MCTFWIRCGLWNVGFCCDHFFRRNCIQISHNARSNASMQAAVDHECDKMRKRMQQWISSFVTRGSCTHFESIGSAALNAYARLAHLAQTSLHLTRKMEKKPSEHEIVHSKYLVVGRKIVKNALDATACTSIIPFMHWIGLNIWMYVCVYCSQSYSIIAYLLAQASLIHPILTSSKAITYDWLKPFQVLKQPLSSTDRMKQQAAKNIHLSHEIFRCLFNWQQFGQQSIACSIQIIFNWFNWLCFVFIFKQICETHNCHNIRFFHSLLEMLMHY